MAAVRAEVPGIAVAFASIGFGHGVFVLFVGRFWAKFRALVKTQWRDGRIEKALAASAFSKFEKLKRGQGRRAVAEKSLEISHKVLRKL